MACPSRITLLVPPLREKLRLRLFVDDAADLKDKDWPLRKSKKYTRAAFGLRSSRKPLRREREQSLNAVPTSSPSFHIKEALQTRTLVKGVQIPLPI